MLTTVTPLLVALLGSDQSSDVQRMGLLVIRRACGASQALFVPSYAALVPSLCALVKGTMGPIKLAAERALGVMLQVEQVRFGWSLNSRCWVNVHVMPPHRRRSQCSSTWRLVRRAPW